MKVKIIDNSIIVFLMHQIPFDKEEELEGEFRKIFLYLKDIYKINVRGYYFVNAYIDDIYGVILEIRNHDSDYFGYFDTIDMQISVIKTTFVYKIDDYFFMDEKDLSKVDIYKYKDKLYLKINDEKMLIKVIENSNIIYNKEEVLINGKKINIVL